MVFVKYFNVGPAMPTEREIGANHAHWGGSSRSFEAGSDAYWGARRVEEAAAEKERRRRQDAEFSLRSWADWADATERRARNRRQAEEERQAEENRQAEEEARQAGQTELARQAERVEEARWAEESRQAAIREAARRRSLTPEQRAAEDRQRAEDAVRAAGLLRKTMYEFEQREESLEREEAKEERSKLATLSVLEISAAVIAGSWFGFSHFPNETILALGGAALSGAVAFSDYVRHSKLRRVAAPVATALVTTGGIYVLHTNHGLAEGMLSDCVLHHPRLMTLETALIGVGLYPKTIMSAFQRATQSVVETKGRVERGVRAKVYAVNHFFDPPLYAANGAGTLWSPDFLKGQEPKVIMPIPYGSFVRASRVERKHGDERTWLRVNVESIGKNHEKPPRHAAGFLDTQYLSPVLTLDQFKKRGAFPVPSKPEHLGTINGHIYLVPKTNTNEPWYELPSGTVVLRLGSPAASGHQEVRVVKKDGTPGPRGFISPKYILG